MSTSGDSSRAELMMMTIADVIKQLVEAHEQGKDINLNKSVHFYASETQLELFSHCIMVNLDS